MDPKLTCASMNFSGVDEVEDPEVRIVLDEPEDSLKNGLEKVARRGVKEDPIRASMTMRRITRGRRKTKDMVSVEVGVGPWDQQSIRLH